jgi:hypothetical protein
VFEDEADDGVWETARTIYSTLSIRTKLVTKTNDDGTVFM